MVPSDLRSFNCAGLAFAASHISEQDFITRELIQTSEARSSFWHAASSRLCVKMRVYQNVSVKLVHNAPGSEHPTATRA